MRQLVVVAVLLVCGIAAAQQGAPLPSSSWPLTWPTEVRERRVALTDAEVKADPVWGRLATRFGYPASIFQSVNGLPGAIPEHRKIVMTWGTNPSSVTDVKLVYPALSAVLGGVMYDLGNGWALHAERGCKGNHILALVELPQPGRPGRDGRNGVDGRNGYDGRDGCDGYDGKNGSSVYCPPQRYVPGAATQAVIDTGGFNFAGLSSKDSHYIGSIGCLNRRNREVRECPPKPPKPKCPPGNPPTPPE